ncbi:MAG TPA: MerR family transcriptional regulator [bacterium]|nr:MerR family transcriptional regulator [bacterium]
MTEEEKLFYSISEAANLVNVKPYVLRYWETEFKKLNPQKSENGQRAYRKKDIQTALAIRKLLYEEQYTIAGANKRLEELEKEGLDQIDLFGAKAAQAPPQAEAAVIPMEVPVQAPEKPAPAPMANPEPPMDIKKLSELRKLLRVSFDILGKYRFN